MRFFKTSSLSLPRLAPFLAPYKGRLALGVTANTLARAADLAPMVLVGKVVDAVNQAGERRVAHTLLAPTTRAWSRTCVGREGWLETRDAVSEGVSRRGPSWMAFSRVISPQFPLDLLGPIAN